MTYENFLDIVDSVSKALNIESEINNNVIIISDFAFVFIDKEVYQDVDKLIAEFKMHADLKRKKYKLFLIPFFVGLSSADISDFIGKDLPFFEYFPDFDLKPADFNFAGLQAFVGFAAFLNNQKPIFNSLYNSVTLVDHLKNYIEVNKRVQNITTVIPKIVLDIQKKYNIDLFDKVFE